MKNRFLFLPLSLALVLSVFAEHHEHSGAGHAENSNSLFQATFLGGYDYAIGHLMQLAEAIPADTYDWAPAEGVRTVEKTLLHVAAANYMLAAKLGATLPSGVEPMSIESKDHDKESAIETLKASIDLAKKTIAELEEEDLATKVEFFGMQQNKMFIVLTIGAHANEHLGQLIAYARSNDITPPWSK
ncbi:DinB family protein [Pelagicoccus sp. SDUM812003]|uniref:DinB family protein n=1 Tax=Pelagicoccus sp. SDUM812003 TaxID=3041267 RepID=UPI00280EABAB|nr:DinB family protein [Pelagicoccus sp. SDUM812003]MDQ8205389.1 DinB family protein [Pelagicoccus sp. SDUM812003]